eukprot:Clim_evm13s244 gene=Clim_evmTU13s244
MSSSPKNEIDGPTAQSPAEQEVNNTFTAEDLLRHQEHQDRTEGWRIRASSKCTFRQGYVKQPVYACLTCEEDNKTTDGEPVGVCQGCANHCHKGHSLEEVYHKRQFCCDCGTKRHGGSCQLNAKDADVINVKNRYGQNFEGKYCWCHSPYDEVTAEDVMTQCYLCEDWFHHACIGERASKLLVQLLDESENKDKEEDREYTLMVCASCTREHESLLGYLTGKKHIRHKDGTYPPAEDLKPMTTGSTTRIFPLDPKPDQCLLLGGEWEDNLCSCNGCKQELENRNMLWLRDGDDLEEDADGQNGAGGPGSVSDTGSVHDAAVNALGQLDYNTQYALVNSYNAMKESLKRGFQEILSQGRNVVTEDDVHQMFEGLKGNKQPRHA